MGNNVSNYTIDANSQLGPVLKDESLWGGVTGLGERLYRIRQAILRAAPNTYDDDALIRVVVFIACQRGDPAIIQWILHKHRPDSVFQSNLLIHMVQTRDLERLATLLEAELGKDGDAWFCALVWATRRDHTRLEVARLLLRHGAPTAEIGGSGDVLFCIVGALPEARDLLVEHGSPSVDVVEAFCLLRCDSATLQDPSAVRRAVRAEQLLAAVRTYAALWDDGSVEEAGAMGGDLRRSFILSTGYKPEFICELRRVIDAWPGGV